MIRAALILAACSVACVNVQDLGAEDTREPAAKPQLVAPSIAMTAARPAVDASSCPAAMPAEHTACSNVAWCSYPLDGRSGLAAKCGCSLGQWICLSVRDSHRLNPVAPDDLPLTSASCTEGARCAQGTECKVGMERWCDCTSSSRLRCRRPTH